MSKLRSISTGIWSDPFIEDLTPKQKLLFIYLITNEKTNMLGIYESSSKKISFETGLEKKDVDSYLLGFEESQKIKRVGNYVILINYMKHQNYNTNMKKSAIDVHNSLPNELKDSDLKVTKENPLEGFETLLNHYGMVRKVEVEYEREEEREIEYEEEKVFSFEVEDCFNNCLPLFDDLSRPTTKKEVDAWKLEIKKIIEIDKIDSATIHHVVKIIRSDSFWSKNFQTIKKLRKKNGDGILYIKYFINYIKNEQRNSKGNAGYDEALRNW